MKTPYNQFCEKCQKAVPSKAKVCPKCKGPVIKKVEDKIVDPGGNEVHPPTPSSPSTVIAETVPPSNPSPPGSETDKKQDEVPGENPFGMTDEEIQELLTMLYEEGGNWLLKKMKRVLLTERECKTWGKMAFKVFKERLRAMEKFPEWSLAIYTAFCFLTKDRTPEGEKEFQERLKQGGKKDEKLSNSGVV